MMLAAASRLPWRRSTVLKAAWLLAVMVAACAPAPTEQPVASEPLTTVNPTSQIASPLADPHAFAVEGQTLRIALASGSLIVTTQGSGAAVELGRAPAGGPGPSGSSQASLFTMACPASIAPLTYFVFGAVTPATSVQYAGPPSVGVGAPDGLFLYALTPASVQPTASFSLSGTGPLAPAFDVPANSFGALVAGGVLQPSGCRVGS